MEFDQGMRKAVKRDTERIYNARIQNNVIQGEKKNIVWVSISHSVVLGTFTKELSGVICENTDFFRLSQDLLWRRQWQPTPVLLPGKSHGPRSLVGYSPRGRKELDTTEQLTFTFHFPALEKEMATHSSVLAWRISGTAEPGWLASMGSHRVGHD